jgi:S-adenosylmethionine synthetase
MSREDEVIVEPMIGGPPDARAVEVVERKGLGHPDTICDALAEEVSRALSRHYLTAFGRVLHHNVDKALLCGGAAAPAFGGGEVVVPLDIILAGRATASYRGADVPIAEIATEACRQWLRAHLHALDPERHVRLECRVRPGSGELVELFGRQGRSTPLANDTSIGVGFAPLSPLERSVLDVERWLNSPETKRDRPETGEDVKVMGTRVGRAVELTVACAFVSAHVADAAAYGEKKASLRDALAGVAARGGAPPAIAVNAADDPRRGSLYLTVTGTSAEAGDDGQVGRGNRVNGLITPGRPMTMEAAAGKNPVSHVGKLYNVAAGDIAQALVAGVQGVTAAECLLVSRIGAPVDEPQAVSLRLASPDGDVTIEQRRAAADLARAGIARIPDLARRLVAGELSVF